MELIKDNVKVEWSRLGEGLSGDYDPNDTSDIELLRFDVSRKVNNEWEEVEDASYCTQVPAATTEKEQKAGLQVIMDNVYDGVMSGNSIKKTCEWLSWISLKDIKLQIEKR